MTTLRPCLLLAAVTLAGCAAPVYDANLGVSGVPVDDGALAGTFAVVSQAADLADIPALGKKQGGGQTFALVVRTWDGDVYAQTNQDCAVVDFDVAGLHTEVSQTTARSVPPYDVPVAVDHGAGAVSATAYKEVWGFHDDGAAMPADASDARVDDMDSDGNPGATITASGLATGEIYVAQRKTLTFTGVVRSVDESFGLLTHKKEAAVLDATNALLKTSATREPDPDPKQSWWHEVRVDGDSCDAVDAAVTAGTISGTRPF